MEREREYPRIPKRMGNPSSLPLYKANSSAVNNLWKKQATTATNNNNNNKNNISSI
jgi:hypothetical protein